MKIVALITIALSLVLSINAQITTPYSSKISTELNKNQILHSMEIWQLASVKGINKMELVIDAVKYNNVKSALELKGMKIELMFETTVPETGAAISTKQFEAYIDESEYSEIMVNINQMITDFVKKNQIEKRGSMTYTTKSGIKFGFIYSDIKEVGYLSILNNNDEISCEFSNIEKFLSELRNYIDIASKDLYLPENAEKLKKAKKSNQEAKDVIIEDI